MCTFCEALQEAVRQCVRQDAGLRGVVHTDAEEEMAIHAVLAQFAKYATRAFFGAAGYAQRAYFE